MTLYELNRWKELHCVIFGHEWNEEYTESEDNGFILEQHKTCTNCRLTCVDISGRLRRYQENKK